MQRIGRILLPTDFSPTADAAFRYAAKLSAETGASLIALHVIAPVYYLEAAELVLLQREAREAAQRGLARLRPAPARTMLANGVPHDMIVQTARSVGADLIVMGTHGRSGLKRLMLGSVAENVLRHAPCPVLTVRGKK
jgi:universal stress protein A